MTTPTKTCGCGGHGCLLCNYTGVVPDLDNQDVPDSGDTRQQSPGPDTSTDFFIRDEKGDVHENPILWI